MSKKAKTSNIVDEKNYGGSSIFYGVLLLLDIALIGYNLYFMRIFKEIGQTYYPVSSSASFIEKFADRYFSFFAQFFGYYPSTKVLAVTIPLAFVFLVWFLDDFSKYLKQKARKKAANLFVAGEQNIPADTTSSPVEQAQDVQSESASESVNVPDASDDSADKAKNAENDAPAADSDKPDTEN